MRAARRPHARPGLIAVVIVLWVVIAAIALTGTLIAAFSQEHPVRFAAPLKIYPVTQEIPGPQCPLGVQGEGGAAPRVDAPITKGRILISGNLTRGDADGLVNRLRGKATESA